MSGFVDFTKRIESRLAAAAREPHWLPGEAESYMSAIAQRRTEFERIAARLCESVVRPRLAMIASYFANANLATGDPPGRCTCWFGYSERFPASAKVGFAVEHDLGLENAVVCYEASMMPPLVKFHGGDNAQWSLDEVDDDAVAEWVEARLLDFLDAYLRIDRGDVDFDEDSATDPVCGMRIGRSEAAASESYRGHAFFFCSAGCREQFLREPNKFVATDSSC